MAGALPLATPLTSGFLIVYWRSVAAGVSVAQETTEKVADGIRQKRNLKGPQEEEGYNVYEVDCWLMVPLDACSSHTEKWTTQGDCVSGRSVNGTTVVWPVVRGMVSAVESASAEMLSRPWHTWQLGANGGKEQRCQPQSELHQPAIKGMMSLQQQTLLQSRGCLDTGSTSCRPVNLRFSASASQVLGLQVCKIMPNS
ncbi:uncharacterized protein RHO17_019834 isoform 4-T5 [Thomomys bottae]